MQPYINKWKICHFISHMLMYPWNVFIIQYIRNQKNYKRAGALKKRKTKHLCELGKLVGSHDICVWLLTFFIGIKERLVTACILVELPGDL